MEENMTRTKCIDDRITTTFGAIYARECEKCKGIFFDVDDNFQYCPLCGRVIESEV